MRGRVLRPPDCVAHVVLVLDFTPRWDNCVVSVAGTLMVRRLMNVKVFERHNEVAGIIYAVIGVVYAVLLGFAAVTVWEGYDKAQAAVEQGNGRYSRPVAGRANLSS